MDIRVTDDPQEFADLCRPWLASTPFSSNVIGVVLELALRPGRQANKEWMWISTLDDGEVAGAAMHTPPHPLFLPALEHGIASEIARHLHGLGRNLAGVNGERTSASEFAAAWTSLTGVTGHLRRAMRMYRLAALEAPVGVVGSALLARDDHLKLVMAWLTEFHHEVAFDEPFDPLGIARRRIRDHEVWLWSVGDELVSLAAHSNVEAGVSRVGPVYTPGEYRGNGYGSAITAVATKAAIDGGAGHVALYTDLANPTSNSIYQRIGFVRDHDADNLSFRD